MNDLRNVPELRLCRACRKIRVPLWLYLKISEWVDMDYPYFSIRNEIKEVAEKELCPQCAKSVLNAYDFANGWCNNDNG